MLILNGILITDKVKGMCFGLHQMSFGFLHMKANRVDPGRKIMLLSCVKFKTDAENVFCYWECNGIKSFIFSVCSIKDG